MKEFGVLGDLGNPTYTHADRESIDIISENCEYTSRLSYDVSENDKILPIMYWIPKMHKSPMCHRFIIASKYVVQKRFLNQCIQIYFWSSRKFPSKGKVQFTLWKYWVFAKC